MSRFYVQKPHVDGLAVIDGEKHALVISSFGDTSDRALDQLERFAAGLNAALSTDWRRTDHFKAIPAPLMWRAVEWLAIMYQDAIK